MLKPMYEDRPNGPVLEIPFQLPGTMPTSNLILRKDFGPTMSRLIPLLLMIVVLSAVSMESSRAETKTPPDAAARFVGDLGAATLKVLQATDGSLSAREAHVRNLLRNNFALEQIGRFVLGKSWRSASPEQQHEYLYLFSEYVLATYSQRLGGYSGESFKIVRAEPVGKQDAIVFTRIDRPSGPPLNAGWRVRQFGDRLLILDVVVEGISMVSAQRSEFASVVKTEGLDGLIQMLRLQVSKFSAQS